MGYYQSNRKEVLQKARERYCREKVAKYYLENKEAVKEKSKNWYKLNIRLNKKEFHKSKQPINLDLANVDQIVTTDKFKHSGDGFKYFIGYKKGEIVRSLMHYLTSNEWIHKIL